MSSGSDHNQRHKTGVTLFASGSGTNAENCMRYFQEHPHIDINLIVTNNPNAGVLEKAKKYDVPSMVFIKKDWENDTMILTSLEQHHTAFIVLAGFLMLLPADIVRAYSGRIINIHPALLPRFGGKGMFGRHIHDALIAAGDTETGITIHEVDEVYDRGKIIFQKKIPVETNDTAQTIEKKVRQLEYYYLPRVIESLISKPPAQ